MFTVRTESGAEYTVRNGRLTRTDGAVNMYLPPELQIPRVVNAPFTNVTSPVVGERWRYRVAGIDGAFTSSPVVSVEQYCDVHDLFGCWISGRDNQPCQRI